MLKMPKSGVPPAWLRSIVSKLPPGPTIFKSVDISPKKIERVIVAAPLAVRADAKVIVSAPGARFAAFIASRKVQPLPMPTTVHAPSSVSAIEFTSKLLDVDAPMWLRESAVDVDALALRPDSIETVPLKGCEPAKALRFTIARSEMIARNHPVGQVHRTRPLNRFCENWANRKRDDDISASRKLPMRSGYREDLSARLRTTKTYQPAFASARLTALDYK